MNATELAARVRELRADAEACRRVAEGLRACRWRCSSDRGRAVLDHNARQNEQIAERLDDEAVALARRVPTALFSF